MNSHGVTDEEAVAVACPTCKAPVGRPCQTLEGAVKRVPHALRYAAAERARA